jgi:hypothetical protein
VVGGKLVGSWQKVFDNAKLKALRARQIEAVRYLDGVVRSAARV